MKLITPILLLSLVACGIQTLLPTPPVPESTPDVFSTLTPDSAQPFAVIGYLPDYRTLDPEWGKYLTDIIYFSAEPRADGTLDTGRFDGNVLSQLHDMQGRNGTRLLISIGGWERSTQFAAMTGNIQTRKKFVDNLAGYVHENKLNGVDFDWEFPQNGTEFQNYIRLLEEVHTDFQPKGLIVSVALSPDLEFPLKDFTVVDRVHIMSYDRRPRHSTYEQAVGDLQKFIDAGIPREKLILGVPFYGRKITAPYEEATYADIVAKYHPAPDVDEVDGIFFNGIGTIQRKTCHAMSENIGGVMIWELGQDSSGDASLLQAIDQAARTGCKR
jgi:GH18 family chitinase